MCDVEKRHYSTTLEDDGVNYRNIAETMTALGFPMNHSSARNHVVRVMKKFAAAFAIYVFGKDVTDEKMMEIAKNPLFQSGIAELLHAVEHQMRSERHSGPRVILKDHASEFENATEVVTGASDQEEEDLLEGLDGGDGTDYVSGPPPEMFALGHHPANA